MTGGGRSEVAIRISKINIAITESSKAYCGQDKNQEEANQEKNTSELTNYKEVSQILGILQENKYHYEGTDADAKSQEKLEGLDFVSGRRFKPVLKSKTYLNN